jgi:hypothetical protein
MAKLSKREQRATLRKPQAVARKLRTAAASRRAAFACYKQLTCTKWTLRMLLLCGGRIKTQPVIGRGYRVIGASSYWHGNVTHVRACRRTHDTRHRWAVLVECDDGVTRHVTSDRLVS